MSKNHFWSTNILVGACLHCLALSLLVSWYVQIVYLLLVALFMIFSFFHSHPSFFFPAPPAFHFPFAQCILLLAAWFLLIAFFYLFPAHRLSTFFCTSTATWLHSGIFYSTSLAHPCILLIPSCSLLLRYSFVDSHISLSFGSIIPHHL